MYYIILEDSVMTEKEFLTPIEAAKVLGISRNGMYDLLRSDKEFPVLRIGRLYKISRTELNHWVEKNSYKGGHCDGKY